MKTKNESGQRVFIRFLVAGLILSTTAKGQQILWFGTLRSSQGKVVQGRFEIVQDSLIRSIVYAPYGLTPIAFQEVVQQGNQLRFTWPSKPAPYHCVLLKQGSSTYSGTCRGENSQPLQLTIREFTQEDAILQGDSLRASLIDLQILDRALALLNKGSNWNHSDNRICDTSAYPYHWSLFCALHQASIDVDTQYKHIRPANQAVRQAIEEATGGKKYAHLLQDFNNEAKSFDAISSVLTRAKEIIDQKLKSHH